MKTIKPLISVILAVSLAVVAFALQKQVTTVSAVSSTIFLPGQFCQWVTIANTGAGDVWLAFDGSVATSNGFPLAHATSIAVVYSGSGQKPVINAILQSGTTTTLNINTSDTSSQ